MRELSVAWWNLENLFDSVDAPRDKKLQKALGKELKGWTSDVLDQKLSQLAAIIGKLNAGKGPDLLGVCEVESRPVLEKLAAKLVLAGRDYGIAHADTQDERGIDVAFVYDKNVLTAGLQFSHFIKKRAATRDLFQVNFKTGAGHDLIIEGNHWPARSPDQWSIEPYRMTAGETLSYWAERIHEECGTHVALLSMGDFNDEPLNRSVTEYALSGNVPDMVEHARAPRFFNLMWPSLATGVGSYYYKNEPNVLDQFWISKGILGGASKFKVKDGSVRIEMFEAMRKSATNPTPKRFGRPSESDKYDPQGFSDHYPISLVLEERD